MGDNRRNRVFADWIAKNFPKAKRVLVVADGNGELSALLKQHRLSVRTIEPNPRHLPKGVKVEKRFFTADTPIREDLIVAMHPDEATLEVVLAAKQQKKPFAVVPCCIVGLKGREVYLGGFPHCDRGWVNKLRDIYGHSTTQTGTLKISGSNTVLFAKQR